jgi:hypothetical protein
MLMKIEESLLMNMSLSVVLHNWNHLKTVVVTSNINPYQRKAFSYPITLSGNITTKTI